MRTQVEPIILLTHAHQNQLIIAQCCNRAVAHGVKPGMKLSHARALIPFEIDHECEDDALIVETYDEEHNLARLHAVAQWCMKRFSPRVAVDPPNGLLIDVTGCERLFHGEDRLRAQLLNAMHRFGFNARAAIAPTVGSAWAVARYRNAGEGDEEERHRAEEDIPFSGVHEVPRGGAFAWNAYDRSTQRRYDERQIVNGDDDLHEALAPLLVQALRLEDETIDALAEIGIVRIEHLLALPRGDLMSRYGPDLLFRLDQAFGEAFESIDALRSDDPPSAVRQFAGPTKQFEAITQTARDLLTDLIEQLAQLEAGALALALELKRVDAPPVCEMIRTSRPTRDRKHLWLLLSLKVERAHLGYGVEEVSLTASRIARLRHRQTNVWSGIDHGDAHQRQHIDAAAGQLIDTIADRIGWDRVQRTEPVETHVPERVTRWMSVLHSALFSFSSRPPLRGDHRGVDPPNGNHASNTKAVHHRKPSPSPDPSLKGGEMTLLLRSRPSMLFDVPKRIDVIATTPDGPVMCVRRPHECEFTPVAHSIGPERINAEWWLRRKNVHAFRDYFAVADYRGRWLWIFRASTTGEWFIHGEWA